LAFPVSESILSDHENFSEQLLAVPEEEVFPSRKHPACYWWPQRPQGQSMMENPIQKIIV